MNENFNEMTEFDNQEISITEKKGKAKKDFKQASPKKIIIAVVIAVILLAVIGISVSFAVNDVNPFSYVASVITNDKKQLVGKWQSQSAPGLSAYVFNEDGTYDSYISSFNFKGEYSTNGYKLTLRNTISGQEVVYKFSVSGDTLSLTLIEEAGAKTEDEETLKFDRVDSLNQKTFSELLENLKPDTDTSESE